MNAGSWYPIKEWPPLHGITYPITDGYLWGIGIPMRDPFIDEIQWESITHKMIPTHWMQIILPEPPELEGKDS